MYKRKFSDKAIKILSEELDRRFEDWVDVMHQEYGDSIPTEEDVNYDAIHTRMCLLLELRANLDTVEIIK